MYRRVIGVISMLLMSWSVAYGLPKGKPFVELNDQIVEVQGILRTMEERFTELLGRIEVIESAVDRTSAMIITLESENALLASVVNDLAIGLEEVSDIQSIIQSHIDALQLEIDLNGDALGSVGQEIKSLNEVIALLESSTAESVDLLLERINENDILIGILSQRQDELDQQLALKQELETGTCGEGEALVGFDSDGSLVCESFLSGTLVKTISKTGVYKVRSSNYIIDMGPLGCDNLIGSGAEVPRQVAYWRNSRFVNTYNYLNGIRFYAFLNSSPWSPDFAEIGSEIYWKVYVKCLELPESFTVDVVEN